MLKQILVLLSLLALVELSKINGKQKATSIGNTYKPTELFMKSSFTTTDICKKFTSRKTFINYLLSNDIYCSGIWCNGNYVYKQSSDSYEIEHIIELKNSELNTYDKNIYGNILLAYGTWNRQLGNLNWTYGKQEKIRVYGKDIVEQAIKNIKICNTPYIENVIEYYIFYKICALLILSFLGIVALINLVLIKGLFYCCRGCEYRDTLDDIEIQLK